MARLQVLRDSKIQFETELKSGTEYVAGRSTQSQILLEGAPEISRSHLKIFEQNGVWKVEVISRFGELYQKIVSPSGQFWEKTEKIEIRDRGEFSVPPFEFLLIHDHEVNDQFGKSQFALVERTPQFPLSENFEDNRMGKDSRGEKALSENTQVIINSINPYLIIHSDGEAHTFQLAGVQWIVGREKTATICFEHPLMSRKHFEIKNENDVYFVRDLGSSNGTSLNGDKLEPQKWFELNSGDRLGIVDLVFEFEIRDSSFEQRLASLPQEIREENPFFESPQNLQFASQSQLQPNQVLDEKKQKTKLFRIRLGIATAVLVLLGFYFSNEGSENKNLSSSEKTSSSQSNAFEKLPAEKKLFIKDTYKLADRLFKEGKFETARQEIAKIHELVPQYEESLQIEKYAAVAIQTQIDQQKAEEIEKQRIEMEAKIKTTVDQCRQRLNSKIEMKEIDDCLSPVIALNPEHAEILALKNQVEEIIGKRAVDRQRAGEREAGIKKLQNLFSKAESLQKADKALEAIEAYQMVANSKLPDPGDLTGKAKREIASLQQKVQTQQSELEKNADELSKAGNLKGAIGALQAALRVNPENEVVKGRLNGLITELKKQMQTIYQEAIFEEGMGEVTTATAKWKKILELSIPEEEYFKKAKMKLKKYEASGD